MAFRYRDNPNDQRVVPSRIAREILEQRNQFLTELQAARRENDQLRAAQEALQVEAEELERRASGAEREAKALRQELAERVDRERSQDVVAPLNRRIQELTRDIERIQERTSISVADARREERVRLLSGLGEVLDSVERALDMGEPEGVWRQGLEAIRTQLHAYLRGEEALVTGRVGEELDPRIHQAIAVVETPDFDAGQIARVDRQGIELQDGTVVRPALVVVAG